MEMAELSTACPSTPALSCLPPSGHMPKAIFTFRSPTAMEQQRKIYLHILQQIGELQERAMRRNVIMPVINRTVPLRKWSPATIVVFQQHFTTTICIGITVAPTMALSML